MSKFSNEEVWGALGYAIDISKMGHLIWEEIYEGAFKNNKSKISIYTGYNSIQCIIDGEDVTIQGGELVPRLYKVAQRSALANKKKPTYLDTFIGEF